MRVRWIVAGLLLFGGVWLAWEWGLFEPLIAWLDGLANRPDAQQAFSDPVHGKVDALIMMVSVVVLAPALALVAVLALVFGFIAISLLLEPFFRLLRLPGWTSVLVVLIVAATGLYWQQGLWLSQSLHVLSLVARAWTVYFGSP